MRFHSRRLHNEVGVVSVGGARLRAADGRRRRPQQLRAALRRHQCGSGAVSTLYTYIIIVLYLKFKVV